MDFTMLENKVVAAKGGDSSSMEWIINEYNPFIMKMVNTTFIPGMDREDIKQELIQSIILAIKKYTGNNTFFWYAVKSMENNIYNKLKKYKKNGNAVNIEDTIIHDNTSIDDNLLKEAEVQDLMRALDMLNENDRELLVKIYIEKYSYQELSEYYGCKYTTISKRKQYALKRLKNHIKAYC